MRLIDAEELKKELLSRAFFPALVKHAIEKCQTVDAVEVVRCKDCKHEKKPEGVKHTNGFCRCEYFFLDLEEDHFCSYGERRAE